LVSLARDALNKILNELSYTTRDGVSFEREEIYEIPQEVIREIISNALVHRSYELESDVIVRIDHKKIEVLSPGGTASSSYENMLNSGSSFPSPRNPTLKKVAENLLIFEGTGKGFKVFWEYASKRGEESMVFESEETPEKATFTKVVLSRPAILDKTEGSTYKPHRDKSSINSGLKVFIVTLMIRKLIVILCGILPTDCVKMVLNV
jgi:predicted HTH transcriptional regulator